MVASSAISLANSHLYGVFAGILGVLSEESLVRLIEQVCIHSLHIMHPALPTLSHHTCIDVEQCGGHSAALSKTILYCDLLQKLTFHTYPHFHVLMEGADDVDQQLWDAKLA